MTVKNQRSRSWIHRTLGRQAAQEVERNRRSRLSASLKKHMRIKVNLTGRGHRWCKNKCSNIYLMNCPRSRKMTRITQFCVKKTILRFKTWTNLSPIFTASKSRPSFLVATSAKNFLTISKKITFAVALKNQTIPTMRSRPRSIHLLSTTICQKSCLARRKLRL